MIYVNLIFHPIKPSAYLLQLAWTEHVIRKRNIETSKVHLFHDNKYNMESVSFHDLMFQFFLQKKDNICSEAQTTMVIL